MSHFIAIEGPIGVGKSALIEAMNKEFGDQKIRSFCETTEQNYFMNLDKFYHNKKKHAFQTQVSFLLSRYKQYEELQKSLKQPEMFEEKIHVADFTLYKNDIFAELTIEDDQEWLLYKKIRDILMDKTTDFKKPDFIVYMRADKKMLMRRVKNRYQRTLHLRLSDDDNDKGITPDYLGKLSAIYDRYMFNYKETPVLVIDTTNIDFVHKQENCGTIIQVIKDSLKKPPKQNSYIMLTTEEQK